MVTTNLLIWKQVMLRHTYATRYIEAGVPAEVLQKLLAIKIFL